MLFPDTNAIALTQPPDVLYCLVLPSAHIAQPLPTALYMPVPNEERVDKAAEGYVSTLDEIVKALENGKNNCK